MSRVGGAPVHACVAPASSLWIRIAGRDDVYELTKRMDTNLADGHTTPD
jgi:hypothetical protein